MERYTVDQINDIAHKPNLCFNVIFLRPKCKKKLKFKQIPVYNKNFPSDITFYRPFE